MASVPSVLELAGPPTRFSRAWWRELLTSRYTLGGAYGLAVVLTAMAVGLVSSPPTSGPIGPATTAILVVLGFNLALILFVAGVVGWGLLALGMHHLPAFIVGILLFDFGVQAAHITNQNRIYGLHPDERSRLTTAYMVTFFFGGVAGSIIASLAYDAGGWLLVCAIGAGLTTAALAIWATICATTERETKI